MKSSLPMSFERKRSPWRTPRPWCSARVQTTSISVSIGEMLDHRGGEGKAPLDGENLGGDHQATLAEIPSLTRQGDLRRDSAGHLQGGWNANGRPKGQARSEEY